jgi:hypothetical protein
VISLLLAISFLASLAAVSSTHAWNVKDPNTVPFSDSQSPVVYEDVVVDSSGTVHVVWMNTGGDAKEGSVSYINGQLTFDAAGQLVVNWGGLQRLTGYTAHSNNRPRVAAADNGTVYVAFGTTDRRYIVVRNPQRGAPGGWIEERAAGMSGGNGSSFAVSLDVDDAGVPYIAWTTGFGSGTSSHVEMTHRGSGSWAPARTISGNYKLARRTEIAVTGSGDGATIHVAFEAQNSSNKFDIRHTHGTRSGSFTDKHLPALIGRASGNHETDPGVTVDQLNNNVYVSYIRPSSGGGYEMVVAQSTDNGNTWPQTGAVSFKQASDIWPGWNDIQAVGSDVRMVSEQKDQDRGFTYVAYQAYNFSTGNNSGFTQISSDRQSASPRFSIGGTGQVAVWIRDGLGRVEYNVDPSGGEAVAPEGNIVINNDAPISTIADATVTFDILGNPDELDYKLSNSPDGLAGSDGYADLPDADTVDWTLDIDQTNACQLETVYAKVLDSASGLESEIMSDDILIDQGVELGSAEIANPTLYANTVPTLQDFPTPGQTASDGDPGYTGTIFYHYLVSAGFGECSGLETVRINGAPLPINDQGISQGFLSLGTNAEDGEYSIAIDATDGIGNSLDTPIVRTIYLDRVAPTIDNLDDENGPVVSVSNDGTPVDENNPSPTILVDVTIENVAVSDNVYGTRGERQSFWGLWIARSMVQLDPANQGEMTDLSWIPMEVQDTEFSVANGTYSFTAQNVNLISGVENPVVGGQQVNYYMYIAFLDGAGNATVQAIESPAVPLSETANLPSIALPLVQR